MGEFMTYKIKIGLLVSLFSACSFLPSLAIDESLTSDMPIQRVTALQSTGNVDLIERGTTRSTKYSLPLAGESARRDTSLVVSGLMKNEDELATLRAYTIAPRSNNDFLPEAVIGPDNRILVRNTTDWPWRVQGKLTMDFPNGRSYIGSGTLINKHHVLTAGHCVFDESLGGWATSITFTPAQNDTARPFGVAVASRLVSVKGWTEEHKPEWDMGMLILDRDIGDSTGWFGIITGPDDILKDYYVNVTGYPGDIPRDGREGRLQYTMRDAIKTVSSEVLGYHIDTYGGQSGSGVWSRWDGYDGYHCAGIHVRGSSRENQATRISQVKFDRIVEWMKAW